MVPQAPTTRSSASQKAPGQLPTEVWQRKLAVTSLKLTEAAARDVLLVRAIEAEDVGAAILTREDRQYATAVALQAGSLPDHPGARETSSFLAHRAHVALDRLAARYPKLQRSRRLARWPQWLNWTVPLAAMALGLATNAIDGERLNILAFPLLGIIAWNLAVYAWLLATWLRNGLGRRPRQPPSRFLDWLLAPSASQLAGHPTLERGVVRFSHDWVNAAAPLTRARANRTLHLSAAAFAAGLLAGMYARARYTVEYTAGWAGTWAGAESEIAALLKVVLGPASTLTGKSLPTVERLRELRGAGENAGDWLTLWIVTAALYVIIPRLLLALFSFVRSERLRRRMAVDQDYYVRRVVRDAVGRARHVRVVPYSFELTRDAADRLKRLLIHVLGEKATVELSAAVDYGKEDEWLQAHGEQLSRCDQVILLFNLSSTPEHENHGAMVSGVRQRLGNSVELLALLDDSGFVHRHRGQPSAARRLDERLNAWRTALAPAGIEPVRFSLDEAAPSDAADQLERALARGAAVA